MVRTLANSDVMPLAYFPTSDIASITDACRWTQNPHAKRMRRDPVLAVVPWKPDRGGMCMHAIVSFPDTDSLRKHYPIIMLMHYTLLWDNAYVMSQGLGTRLCMLCY